MIKFIYLILFFIFTLCFTNAHEGTLNADGCHTKYENGQAIDYHCHTNQETYKDIEQVCELEKYDADKDYELNEEEDEDDEREYYCTNPYTDEKIFPTENTIDHFTEENDIFYINKLDEFLNNGNKCEDIQESQVYNTAINDIKRVYYYQGDSLDWDGFKDTLRERQKELDKLEEDIDKLYKDYEDIEKSIEEEIAEEDRSQQSNYYTGVQKTKDERIQERKESLESFINYKYYTYLLKYQSLQYTKNKLDWYNNVVIQKCNVNPITDDQQIKTEKQIELEKQQNILREKVRSLYKKKPNVLINLLPRIKQLKDILDKDSNKYMLLIAIEEEILILSLDPDLADVLK